MCIFCTMIYYRYRETVARSKITAGGTRISGATWRDYLCIRFATTQNHNITKKILYENNKYNVQPNIDALHSPSFSCRPIRQQNSVGSRAWVRRNSFIVCSWRTDGYKVEFIVTIRLKMLSDSNAITNKRNVDQNYPKSPKRLYFKH